MKVVHCAQCDDFAEWRGTIEEMHLLGWRLARPQETEPFEHDEMACFWLCKACTPTYH
jgi:hypothetical protein